MEAFYGKHSISFLSHNEILTILHQFAAALVCASKRGLWFRDLGSPNILYHRETKQLCIIDLDGTMAVDSSILLGVNRLKSEKYMTYRLNKELSKGVKFVDPIFSVAVHILCLLGHRQFFSVGMKLEHLMKIQWGKDWARVWGEHIRGLEKNSVQRSNNVQSNVSFNDVLDESKPVDASILKFLSRSLDMQFTKRMSSLILFATPSYQEPRGQKSIS